MLPCVHMRKIAEGKWDDITSWEFFLDSTEPPSELCTAVACVGFTPDLEHVVLTRNHRGWENVGGHIEQGESLEDTLLREALEEGGYAPTNPQLFAHRKLTSTKPVPHNQLPGVFYPHPHTYIPYFVTIVPGALAEPTGEEIFECRAVALSELADYINDHQIAVVHAARDQLNRSITDF